MISRNTTNPSIWIASNSMAPSLLAYYVGRVMEEGGNFLIVNGDYVDVREAARVKARAEEEVLKASRLLAELDVSGKGSDAWFRMITAARSAGQQYRIYARYLNLSGNPLGTPWLLSTHSELDQAFKEGSSWNPFCVHDGYN